MATSDYGFSPNWGKIRAEIGQYESTTGRKYPKRLLKQFLEGDLRAQRETMNQLVQINKQNQIAEKKLTLDEQLGYANIAQRRSESEASAANAAAQTEIARAQLEAARTEREAQQRRWEKEFGLRESESGVNTALQQRLAGAQETAGWGQLGLTGVALGMMPLGKNAAGETTTLFGKAGEFLGIGGKGVGKEVGKGAGEMVGSGVQSNIPTTQTGVNLVAPETAGAATSGISSGLTSLYGSEAGSAGLAANIAMEGTATEALAAEGALAMEGTTSSFSGLVGAGAMGGLVGGIAGPMLAKQNWWTDITPWGGEKTETVAGGIITGAATGFLMGGPIGAVIGGIFGGISAWLSTTVICTELNRQGYIPDDVLIAESQYRVKFIDSEVYWGYRTIADPIVRLMKRSKIITQIVRPFGVAYAYEMASRVNPKFRGRLLGRMVLGLGKPICKAVFRFKKNNIISLEVGR